MAFSTDFRSIINYANANATGYTDRAQQALDTATGNIASLGYTAPIWKSISPAKPPQLGQLPQAPILNPVTLNLPPDVPPAEPVAPLTPLRLEALPPNMAQKPTLYQPNKPSPIGRVPGKPPIKTDFDFPDPPAELSRQLPAAPTFISRAEPTAPQILLPSFEAERPLHTADAPTDAAGQMQASYIGTLLSSRANADAYVSAWIDRENPAHRAQLAKLEAELERSLQGGTGIKAEVQNAIIDRAREKQSRDADATRLAAYSEAASRGFTLPSGALMSAVARARQEASNNVSKAITDLAVAQMEMEQRNLQFAVTTSANLRQAMVSASLNYMGQIVSLNGQAMDYAKSVFANVVELYNASVRVFSARVDAYRTYASIYESQIKAAMAKLEVYQAEIDALKALTDVDQSKINLYKIQVDAITSVIAMYRAQIEAVQGRASLEKIKLEVFQIEVQAYGVQAQAKNSEWNGYTAELSGEEIKQKSYATELAAYNSELDAYKTRLSALVAENDAAAKNHQAKADNYRNSVAGYTAKVEAAKAKALAENEINRDLLNRFDSEMAGFELKTKVALAQYTVESENNAKNATSNLTAQVEKARGMLDYGKALADISVAASKVHGDLAGAAMAGLNTLVAGNEEI